MAHWEAFVGYEFRWFCPDPWDARDFLEFAVRTLPRKNTRELRKRLEELDDLY